MSSEDCSLKLTITTPICSGAHAHVLPEQPVQVHDGEPELGLVDEGNRVPEAERLKRAFGEIGPAPRFDQFGNCDTAASFAVKCGWRMKVTFRESH
jgi:hypothetical protein